MKQALRAGLKHDEFWNLSPLETRMFIRASIWRNNRLDDALISQAWHGEAFARQKRLQPLERVLRGNKGTVKLKGKELIQRKEEFKTVASGSSTEALIERLNKRHD